MLTIEGKELVLTGGSRNQMFLPEHTDRYRYGDGAFRLTDRRFIGAGDSGYDRLWDGLAAEQVGRTADAERNYREAADPARTPHSGTVLHYAMAPLELSPGELERFGQALRAFARFRLAAMLKETKGEALTARDDPYADLLAAMKKAPTRKAGCQAASAWAQAHPAFLKAFNLGGGWPPDLSLCGHMRFEDSLDAPQP